MKIGVRSKSLVKIILFSLYMESCCCLKIYRESRDVSDLLGVKNCDQIPKTFLELGRCRCSLVSSIVSTDTGQLQCIANKDIDKSKYTQMLLYSMLSVSLRKIVAMLSILF